MAGLRGSLSGRPPVRYPCAARPLRRRKERLCGAEREGGPHQPAGHPGSAQGQPPRRHRPRRQSGGTGHQRKPACRAVRRHHPAPHRLLRHPRHAGKLPRQRHPRPSAPPSLPVGASAHPAALYRLGSPPRPRRGTGRGDERPCRRSTRRRTGGAEPESRLQPVPDPFARHNAGRTCRLVGRPRRPDRRPRGGGGTGRKAGGVPREPPAAAVVQGGRGARSRMGSRPYRRGADRRRPARVRKTDLLL